MSYHGRRRPITEQLAPDLDASNVTMKQTPWLYLFLLPLAYLLIAATAGALLAYPIDQALDGTFRLYKVINRCTLALMLLGIVPVMGWLKLNTADLGLPKSRRQLGHQFFHGFVYGVLILSLVILCVIALQIRIVQFDRLLSLGKVIHEVSLAIIVSLVVAILEEILFRGFMFAALLKFAGPLYAMSLTALYYAALHFMRSDLTVPADQLDWSSGLIVMVDAFGQVFNRSHFDSFIALFLASIFLTCVRYFVRGSLVYCIGLHAGWVFTIKLTKAFTELHPAAAWGILVGSYDGLIGYLSSGWLLVLIGAFVWLVGYRRPQSPG